MWGPGSVFRAVVTDAGGGENRLAIAEDQSLAF